MFGKKKELLEVIDICGVISSGEDKFDKYKHNDVINELIDISKDDDVKGVMLRINSPGGSAGASMELALSIERLSKIKPVVVYVSDMACSGALLASVAGSRIFASPMALIGSIGVIMQVPNVKEISDKFGVKMITVKSGEMKDIGNPFRDMTEEEKTYLQASVNASHEMFKDYVERRRSTGMIDKISDGRFFDAPKALDCKLIDELGTQFDAMEWLKKKADAYDAEWVEMEESGGFIEKFLRKIMFSAIGSFKTETGLILK